MLQSLELNSTVELRSHLLDVMKSRECLVRLKDEGARFLISTCTCAVCAEARKLWCNLPVPTRDRIHHSLQSDLKGEKDQSKIYKVEKLLGTFSFSLLYRW